MSEDIDVTLLSAGDERNVKAGSSDISETRAEGNLDIRSLIELLQDMIKVDSPAVILVPRYPKYLKVGTEENKFTMDNPTKKFRPTITYNIVRREPATIGGNKEPFGTGQKDRTPKERMRSGKPDGTQVVIYGQLFDNLVKFEIFALSNTEAEAYADWFEQYLRVKRPFLRNMGIHEILFWSRGEDQTVPELDSRVEKRTITFFVRTEELSSTDEDILKNLEFKLGLQD